MSDFGTISLFDAFINVKEGEKEVHIRDTVLYKSFPEDISDRTLSIIINIFHNMQMFFHGTGFRNLIQFKNINTMLCKKLYDNGIDIFDVTYERFTKEAKESTANEKIPSKLELTKMLDNDLIYICEGLDKDNFSKIAKIFDKDDKFYFLLCLIEILLVRFGKGSFQSWFVYDFEDLMKVIEIHYKLSVVPILQKHKVTENCKTEQEFLNRSFKIFTDLYTDAFFEDPMSEDEKIAKRAGDDCKFALDLYQSIYLADMPPEAKIERYEIYKVFCMTYYTDKTKIREFLMKAMTGEITPEDIEKIEKVQAKGKVTVNKEKALSGKNAPEDVEKFESIQPKGKITDNKK